MRRVVGDLALGAQLALSGGPRTRLRTLLTAVGVGLGVVLLLGATSVPALVEAHRDRAHAREWMQFNGDVRKAAPDTMLASGVHTAFLGDQIEGVLLQPEGAEAPVPPGLRSVPAAGTMVVSPALAELLASPDGRRLLAPRFPYRLAGTIAPEGLRGPEELYFYAGSDALSGGGPVLRIDAFGSEVAPKRMDPILVVVTVVAVVVLLLPIALFLAAAVRFGGEQRNRRLAALRLVGADAWMARRIAAGEATLGAAAGLVVGGVLFVLLRPVGETLAPFDAGVYAADMRPSTPLMVAVLAFVPALAVMVSLLALRSVTIDPMGVVRQSRPRRRRVVWRLLLPVSGALLLLPLSGVNSATGDRFNEVQIAVGVAALLVGIAVLLPWLVETAVHRLRGGGVAWQLAVRRLQLDSGTSARVVSGIAVAVAGAITLQTLFGGVDGQFTRVTGDQAETAHVSVERAGAGTSLASLQDDLRRIDGVREVIAQAQYSLRTMRGHHVHQLTVAGCPTLRTLLAISDCREGDVFVTRSGRAQLRPGEAVRIQGRAWTAPAGLEAARTRANFMHLRVAGVLATPGAVADLRLPTRVYADLSYSAATPDTLELVRNAAAAAGPVVFVDAPSPTETNPDLIAIRRGLLVGAIAVLLLIAASLLVGVIEQVHERRRLLGALAAFGTPRRTISRSLMLQTAVPVAFGLVLAILTGTTLGALLLRLINAPVRIDLPAVALLAVTGMAIVPLVTALSLPALRRVMQPESLRAE